mmetsp:Transcript_9506/g.14159  ORF Transcript_9506/g.14159 Transcript_9506/m.14159 type:complete len:478 (+) Transcript_9506:2-1435(+)
MKTDPKTLLQGTLDQLGWGRYHRSLFVNCCFGTALIMVWPILISIILLDLEQGTSIGSLLAVVYNVGAFAGCIWFSRMAANIGRAYTFQRMILFSALGSLLLVFAPGIYYMLPCSFLLGLGNGGELVVTYTVFIENLPSIKKNLVNVINLMWALGGISVAAIALLLFFTGTGNFEIWRVTCLVFSLLCFVFAYFRTYVLESPAFLYEHHEMRNLARVLRKLAKYNQKNEALVKEFLRSLPSQYELATKQSVRKLMRPGLRHVTLKITVAGSLSALVFFGVVFFMPVWTIPDEKWMAFVLVISMQASAIPGTYIGTLLLKCKLGVKKLHIASNSAVGLLVLLFLISEQFYYQLALACFFYLLNTVNGTVLSTIVAESYPSQVRAVGVGWETAVFRLAGGFAPVLFGPVYEKGGLSTCMIVLACLLFLMALFSLVLVENKPLKVRFSMPVSEIPPGLIQRARTLNAQNMLHEIIPGELS